MTNYQEPKEIQESLTDMYNDVVQFMTSFEQEVSPKQKELSEIDENIIKLRASLIKEEYEELLNSKTRTDELDALLDLMYVSLGTLASFGYKPYYINTNYYPENYDSRFKNLDTIYAKQNYEELNRFYNSLIFENSFNLEITNTKELFYLLNNFIIEIYELGNRLFPKFNEAFLEVHRSNMSKLDENGKIIKNEVGKVIKSSNYSPADLTQYS